MKFITFNLSDDLILTPSCADAVYALENDSTELMINHKIKEGMVYELHKEQNGRKDFVTLEKADDHLYYILNNSFLKTSGRCSLQIRMIGESDFAQHSNKVEISIGTFINAKNEPSPVQKQVIEDLLVASDKNLETTKTLLSEADILKDKAADLETLDVKDNGEGIDVYYKGVQYHLYDGAKGDKGDKGDVGPQGPQGIPGADGRDGMDGAPGPKGDKGDTGEKGATGPRGYTGERGPQGAQGYQGPRGPVGAQGERGEPGTDGFSPIANVHRTEEDDGVIISITDKTGTTVAIVHDGHGGGGEGDVTKEYLEENYYNKTEVDTSFSDVIRSINDTREDVDNLINDMDSKADKTETNNKISEIETSLNSKQDMLVDGINIKTINGESILGEGNFEIQSGTNVEMVDNPNGGVDLTVDDRVRTLVNDTQLSIVEVHVEDGFKEINSKIDELQLFKFPNATIIGEPTINNGQISGFSATSYLKFPFLVDFQSRPFEINMGFTTGSNIQNQENIFDSDFGLAFAIRNSKFVIAISTNGTSWNLGEGVGTHTVLANTTYRVKLWWDRMTYHLAYSTDGGKNYTEDITKVGTYQPAPKQMYIGAGENFGEVFNWFTGIINMNHCTLSILDQIIWSGMDDAGLATRLEVDMSNIDQAGIDYINGLIDAKAKPVDMVDNTTAGVNLTVGSETRTLSQISELLNGFKTTNYKDGYALDKNGFIFEDQAFYISDLIPVTPKSQITWHPDVVRAGATHCLWECDANGNYITYWSMNANPRTFTLVDNNTAYIRATFYKGTTDAHTGKILNSSGEIIYQAGVSHQIDGLEGLNSRMVALETALTGVDELIGSGVIE